MSKITKIPSEIRNFFSENRRSTTIDTFTRLVENINLDCRSLGGTKRENCKLTSLQVFQLLILLPFFAVSGFSHYGESVLHRIFGGKKDLFYSFMSQDTINWRKVIYRITNSLITKVVVRKDYKKSSLPTVLIADDTDLPKTGLHMEGIGKIFSHIHQRCILGYKALMLCWSDGRTQFMLDFSMHGEKGKVEGKEQGLTSSQRQKRYERQREKESPMAKRKDEYFKSKGEKLVEMVKDAISNKVPFDYLLVDSWFTCTELVDFVCRRHKKFHLLGMAKMGNTKYTTSKEVFFSDSKRILGLTEYSARDFSAQVSHVSLVLIRYNLLASIKRAFDYETIGGLFKDAYMGVHVLTVVEKIWSIILEVVAEMIGVDSDELTMQVIECDKRLAALRVYAQTV